MKIASTYVFDKSVVLKGCFGQIVNPRLNKKLFLAHFNQRHIYTSLFCKSSSPLDYLFCIFDNLLQNERCKKEQNNHPTCISFFEDKAVASI